MTLVALIIRLNVKWILNIKMHLNGANKGLELKKKTFIWLKSKGQLISKCLFGVFSLFQNTNENKSTWGIIVVKSNSFIHILEEMSAWKNHFNFVWPLVGAKPAQNLKSFVISYFLFWPALIWRFFWRRRIECAAF